VKNGGGGSGGAEPCTVCRGSGSCSFCNGDGYAIEREALTPCGVCSATGACQVCKTGDA
jgi:hypothetical protein